MRQWIVFAAAVGSVAGCASSGERCPDDEPVEAIIVREAARGPAVRAQDVVKLLYLGAMGPAHRGMSEAGAARWLREEAAALTPAPAAEPLADTIAPGGAMVRVHLRPYLESGGDLDSLAAWHVATAGEFVPDSTRLACWIRVAVRLARSGRPGISADSLVWHLSRLERGERSSPEHSEAFVRAFRPAYRVIAGRFAERLPARGQPARGAAP